jgi:hypothetical protein
MALFLTYGASICNRRRIAFSYWSDGSCKALAGSHRRGLPSCVIGDRIGTISCIADLRTEKQNAPEIRGRSAFSDSAVRRAD